LDESHKTLQRLEQLRHLNADRKRENEGLYRLMYKTDLYIIAYERMKSAPGNLTPGSDGNTIDGFSLETIQEIIQEMRTEQFRFKPVRTVYIPKSNGKMRKLGIPSIRDKVVQEVIRMILEAIYDSPYGAYFHKTSHGFRPNCSCHTALREIRNTWTGVNWLLEGDIRACFDELDHGVLVTLLRKKIKDERFINLIWKLLRAGYFDLQEGRKDSLAGTPQGGLASPILANVYLHELDEKIEEIRKREQKGKKKSESLPYKRITNRLAYLRKKGEKTSKEIRELIKRMRRMPSVEVNDPTFIRVKYQRYADDWIVGIAGPRSLAEQIKDELKAFLQERLKLTLSEEKTRITHAREEQAHFLGTLISVGSTAGGTKIALTKNGNGHLIKRRSTGKEILMKAPIKDLVQRLHAKGFCTVEGKPTSKRGWSSLDADQIIGLYSSINRGIQNYYRFADNFQQLTRIQYILQFSLAKTLAAKYKISGKKVFRRFGKTMTVTIKAEDGKQDRIVSFYLNHDGTKQRNGFTTRETKIDLVRWAIRMRTRSKLGKACCICNSPTRVEMHHVRHIRKIDGKKPTGFHVILQALNRKQVPVCKGCHKKIHRGEYDEMRLSDLAYNPYASGKRK
jgi:group II intron reverse transcriptase/maturase